MIEVIPVGGFSEIGRNSVVIQYDNQAVLLDFGLKMENYIDLQEASDRSPTQSELVEADAVPNYEQIEKGVGGLKAVCVSHAHLDHVGALPYFINNLDADVHATRFTMEVLKGKLDDKNITARNDLVEHDQSDTFQVSEDLTIEFIKITHSVPQTVAIVVHTPDGCVIYTPDFKLDNAPMLGGRTNYQALENLDNVQGLIMDSLYSLEDGKTQSEAVAKEMLRDVLLGTTTKNKNVVTTTFSSHIARLKIICDLAKSLNRKPVMIGRSLASYVDAARKAGIIDLESRTADMVRYGGQLEEYFRNLEETKDKLFIVTGHQGEPNAILSRMVQDDIFPFENEDAVVFSCEVIPIEKSEKNREILEDAIEDKGVRIYKNVHVSGHARKEDHRELINMVEPNNFIPTHGDVEMLESSTTLAEQMGYKDDQLHILENYEKLLL